MGDSAASNCGAPSLSLLRDLSGVVFVQTNAAKHNKIIAFERASNRTLSNAGEFDTGGRGSGGVNDPLESQGSVKLSQDQSFLFAVNAGSETVSVFGVHRGNLALLKRSSLVEVSRWPWLSIQPGVCAQLQRCWKCCRLSTGLWRSSNSPQRRDKLPHR
jgi:hypothetical protein